MYMPPQFMTRRPRFPVQQKPNSVAMPRPNPYPIDKPFDGGPRVSGSAGGIYSPNKPGMEEAPLYPMEAPGSGGSNPQGDAPFGYTQEGGFGQGFAPDFAQEGGLGQEFGQLRQAMGSGGSDPRGPAPFGYTQEGGFGQKPVFQAGPTTINAPNPVSGLPVMRGGYGGPQKPNLPPVPQVGPQKPNLTPIRQPVSGGPAAIFSPPKPRGGPYGMRPRGRYQQFSDGGKVLAMPPQFLKNPAFVVPDAAPPIDPKAGISRAGDIPPSANPLGYVDPTAAPNPYERRLEAMAPQELGPNVIPQAGTGRRAVLGAGGDFTSRFPVVGARRRERPLGYADGGKIPQTMASPFEGAEMRMSVIGGGTMPSMFGKDAEFPEERQGYANGGRVKKAEGYAKGGRVAQNKRTLGTLRSLLPNITPAQWAAANSLEGGGNEAARQAIWSAIQQASNLNGGWGSAGAYASGASRPNDGYTISQEAYDSGIVPEGRADISGYYTGERGANGYFDNANRVNIPDGYSPVNSGGTNGFLEDRGDYNYAIPDLGAIEYDDAAGLVNNQARIPGSRVDRAHNNFSNAVYAGIAAIGAGAVYTGAGGTAFTGAETSAGGASGGGGAGYGVNTGVNFGGAGGGAGYGVNTGVSFGGAGAGGGLGGAAGAGGGLAGAGGAAGGASAGGIAGSGISWQQAAQLAGGLLGAAGGGGEEGEDFGDYTSPPPGYTGEYDGTGGYDETGGGDTAGDGVTGGVTGGVTSNYPAPRSYDDYLRTMGGASAQATNINVGIGTGLKTQSGAYYEEKYRPIEDQLLEETRKMGDPSFAETRASEAMADVANTFQAQRGAVGRDAARRGVTVRPEQYASMGVSEAAARALAANRARSAGRDEAFTKQAGVVNMGDRYLQRQAAIEEAAARSAGQAAVAASGADAAASARREAMAFNASQSDLNRADRRYEYDTGTGTRRREFDTTTRDNRHRFGVDSNIRREAIARGVYESDRNHSSNRDAQNRRNRQQNLQGIGTLISAAGSWFGGKRGNGYADGGEVIDGHAEEVPDGNDGGPVDGPGSETSDSIPATLSKGEFVINAETVAALDKTAPDILNKLNNIGLKMRAIRMGIPQFSPAEMRS